MDKISRYEENVILQVINFKAKTYKNLQKKKHEIQYNTTSLYYINKIFLLKMQSSRSTSEFTSVRGTDVFIVLSLPLVISARNLQTLQLS